jgi:hypothetical protein
MQTATEISLQVSERLSKLGVNTKRYIEEEHIEEDMRGLVETEVRVLDQVCSKAHTIRSLLGRDRSG